MLQIFLVLATGFSFPAIFIWMGYAAYAFFANEHLLNSLLKRGYIVKSHIVLDEVEVSVENALPENSSEKENG